MVHPLQCPLLQPYDLRPALRADAPLILDLVSALFGDEGPDHPTEQDRRDEPATRSAGERAPGILKRVKEMDI